jgi:hypothetical protein
MELPDGSGQWLVSGMRDFLLRHGSMHASLGVQVGCSVALRHEHAWRGWLKRINRSAPNMTLIFVGGRMDARSGEVQSHVPWLGERVAIVLATPSVVGWATRLSILRKLRLSQDRYCCVTTQ